MALTEASRHGEKIARLYAPSRKYAKLGQSNERSFPAFEYPMPPLNLDTLNDEQRRAVLYGSGESWVGPLLIIAGAGSGKTNTLAHRVAHLVAEGTDLIGCCF